MRGGQCRRYGGLNQFWIPLVDCSFKTLGNFDLRLCRLGLHLASIVGALKAMDGEIGAPPRRRANWCAAESPPPTALSMLTSTTVRVGRPGFKIGSSEVGSPSCAPLGTGQVVCAAMGPNNKLSSVVGP